MKIADIPFKETTPSKLLRLSCVGEYIKEPSRLDIQYGYCYIDYIKLTNRYDYRDKIINNALLIALHSNESKNPYNDDIELAFEFPKFKIFTEIILVKLSSFLNQKVYTIKNAINKKYDKLILSVCNYDEVNIRKPDCFIDIPVYYALGEVLSYTEVDTDFEGKIIKANIELPILEANNWIYLK